MTTQTNKAFYLSDKILLWSIFVIFGLMSLCTLIFGNGTFVDVMRGYVSMEQFLDGETFNTLNYTLASGKESYFIAWWTPGQYLLPYSFNLLGLPMWLSQGIWIVIFTGLSLWGYYRLFQHFGFSINRSLLSVLIILTNQLFFWNTLLYYGGSLFEIGLLPWFLLFLLKLKQNFTWRDALIYCAVAIGLFFLKATFLMHAGIGLAVLLIGFKNLKIKNIVWIILSGIIVLAVCYFGFLQFGETPSSAHDFGSYNSIPNNIWMDLTTPLVSLLGISTNVGVVVHKLFPWTKDAWIFTVILFPILAMAGVLLLRNVYFRDENSKKLVAYTVFFFFCFSIFFLNNNAVSYDFRHFGPLSFVFVPFTLDFIQKWLKQDWLLISGLNILLVFNLILFGFQRLEFGLSMSHIDGIYQDHIDANSFGNMQKVSKAVSENATIVLIDSWTLMYFLKDRNCLPVFSSHGKWVLKSGIEVAKPRLINFDKDFGEVDEIVIFYPGYTDNPPFKLSGIKWTSPDYSTNRFHTIFKGKRLP